MEKHKKGLHMVTFILLAIGGLNWGLVAIGKWDLSDLMGGMDSTVSRVVFALIGLAAIYLLVTHKKDCKECGGEKSAGPSTTPTAPSAGA